MFYLCVWGVIHGAFRPILANPVLTDNAVAIFSWLRDCPSFGYHGGIFHVPKSTIERVVKEVF